MRRNAIETIMGAAVVLVAVVFVVFAFSATGVTTVSGYKVHARFDNAAGLSPGTDVRLSGVKVGSVVAQRLDPETYFADVTMSIDEDVKLPRDTSARIVPEGLLGGNYVMLEPGGMMEMIEKGGTIEYTQGAVNIVDLVGRLIFSGEEGASGGDAQDGGAFPQ